jgi:hypothetical protein
MSSCAPTHRQRISPCLASCRSGDPRAPRDNACLADVFILATYFAITLPQVQQRSIHRLFLRGLHGGQLRSLAGVAAKPPGGLSTISGASQFTLRETCLRTIRRFVPSRGPFLTRAYAVVVDGDDGAQRRPKVINPNRFRSKTRPV